MLLQTSRKGHGLAFVEPCIDPKQGPAHEAKKSIQGPLDHKFGYEHGLNIAVAFTAFDTEKENILRADIGRIVYKEYRWGYDNDDEYFVKGDGL